MTAQHLSSTARAPAAPNKPVGEADYARVIDGQLHLRLAGQLVPSTGWDATMILLTLDGSPFPESQERARQIKAALRETMQ